VELPVLPAADTAAAIPLTVTHVLEHLYCARFTYFEYVLQVPERQERRALVVKGRDAHQERRRTNPTYLRKKLGVTARAFDVPLASAVLGVRGSVDEVLTLSDGTMAPLDYKFAEAPGAVYLNQRAQAALYGLLIRERFGVPVTRAYLCYLRSAHRIVEVALDEAIFAEARSAVSEVQDVIRSGWFPPATRWRGRCRDCCYRNICIR
jgi:CRISPR-associated exonuclease Cas4